MSYRAVLLGAAVLAAAPLHAQLLSLDEALRAGERQSPRLAAQRHSIAASGEQLGRAAELPDPKLRLGLENLPVTGEQRYRYDQDFMTMRSIGLMQEFPNQAKRRARDARARAMHAVGRAGLAAQRADVQTEIARAWLDVHYAEKARAEIERFASQYRLQIDAVTTGVARGRQGAAQSYVLRQAFEQANDRAIEQERALEKARIRLASWLPDDARRPLAPPPDTARLARSREQLLAELAALPALRVLEEREGLARAEVELARSMGRSDWSLEIGYAQREPAFSNMVSVMVTMDLPWQARNRQDRDIAARLAGTDQARALREQERRRRETDLRGWFADFETAHKRVERFGTVLVPLARERVAAARAAYRGASAELGPVLEAERSVTEAELGLLQAEAERAQAWARLTFVYPQGEQP
jgi:outer membrane protein TolC